MNNMLYKLKDSEFSWKVVFSNDFMYGDTKTFSRNAIFLDLGYSYNAPLGIIIKVLHESEVLWMYKNSLEEFK